MVQTVQKLGIGLMAIALVWLGGTAPAMAHPYHALLNLLEQPQQSPLVMVSGLGLAFLLGAGHALSPGHGKTMVAAYLIGTQGTPWHAVLLGLVTTATHTAAVFALGLVALFASRYGVPEQLYPSMSFISGLMVCSVGISLLSDRLHGLTHADDSHSHAHPHVHGHGHSHPHAHPHPHPHGAASDGTQSSRVGSVSSLLTLGVAGGIVPCPSALVLLLAAIALHQTAYGMVLISSFSLGLTAVLIGLGLGVIYARQWLDQLPSLGAIARWLSVVSAIAVIVVGVVLTTYAVVG